MEIEQQLRQTRIRTDDDERTFVEGCIRINPKNYNDAFVNNPDGGPDIYIEGLQARNAAMNGDLVVVQINKQAKWKLNRNLIVDRWDDWSELLMPIIQTLENTETEPSNHDVTEGKNPKDEKQGRSKSRHKRSLVDNAMRPASGKAGFDTSKLPSNLPRGISKLQVEHIFNLPLSAYCIQKTGLVSQIVKRSHSCVAGGFLRPFSDDFALFSPNDSRVPRMLIAIDQCPLDFPSQADRYKDVLFVAQMDQWDPKDKYAKGSLIKVIGDSNSVQSRMEALLLENQIYDEDFHPDAYAELTYLDKLPKGWFKKNSVGRRDLTNECIFTIDPKTARDLDDAVSIKQVAEQIYEVGVHIADVSYFVHELSAVDNQARLRTTSVYLVDRVIPMLPRALCEQMCSLNPNEPKLTYSVIWKMDKYGRIIDEWFGRTVIKSCVKLAYEEAQDLIDSEDCNWIKEKTNMPKLYAYDWKHIQKSVKLLNKIAMNMRAKRFQGGALKIEQVKLKFELDRKSGMPTGFAFENRTSANFLIEEYMLLANMAVAKRIYKYSKDLAFLRRHPSSSTSMLNEVKEFCDAKGFSMDITSAGSIQRSINAITDPTISKVVSFMLLRSMKNAEYVCTGALSRDDPNFSHFALNVPFYTHFTSPIRRYADIIVHRQLSLALGKGQPTKEDVGSLAQMAEECTKRKISSKLISDTSQRLYFNLFVQKAGFCELLACVTRIQDRSIDIILADYDRQGRVHLNDLKPHLESMKFEIHSGNRSLVLNWKQASDGKADPENGMVIKKKKRAKLKSSNGELKSRANLETGKVFKAKLPINEARNNTQTIRIFDVVRVIVTVNPKDITALRISLKTPSL